MIIKFNDEIILKDWESSYFYSTVWYRDVTSNQLDKFLYLKDRVGLIHCDINYRWIPRFIGIFENLYQFFPKEILRDGFSNLEEGKQYIDKFLIKIDKLKIFG